MSYKLVRNIGKNHSPRSKYGYGSSIDGITVHHWGSTGQKFRNVVDWLRGYTGNNGSSAHYVVQDGLVEQIVEDSRASWHGGNNKANGTTIGIEMRPEMTAGDWETLVELCVNLERKHGSMKYYGHKDWKNTACPGDYYPRLGELVDAVNAYHKTGKVPSTTGGGSSSGGGNTYTSVSGSTPLVKLYHKGEPVERIQKAVGVKVDGFYGPATASAVGEFQKDHGLSADKIVGDKTWAAINGGKASRPSESKAPNFPLRKGHWYGPESSNSKNHSGYYPKDRQGIRRFQQKLKDRGWTIGVDGLFGSQTSKVVKQFQTEKGLSVDGGVGIETWNAIWSEPVT